MIFGWELSITTGQNTLKRIDSYFISNQFYTPDIFRQHPNLSLPQIIKNTIMQTTKIESFQIIGISIRTSNENNQTAQDIGQLWAKFMSEGILQKIPNKISEEILSIYTNYESDHTKPYDTILGCKVSSLNTIPDGMVGQSFEGGTFAQFLSKGDATKGAVYNTWSEIWNTDLNRLYTADFEVYGERAQNPSDAEVDIFVSVKE